MREIQFSAVEKTLGLRIGALIADMLGRALGESGVPYSQEKNNLTSHAISRATINFINDVRETREGMPIENQNAWVGATCLEILRTIWSVTPREPTPEERRLQMRVLN